MQIKQFSPLFLTVDRIGPFQERLEEFDFTDVNEEPCNVFLFASKNGRGKTTLLELMVAMMNMLGKTKLESFGFEPLDYGKGRAQWDILVRTQRDGVDKVWVLSLIAGFIGNNFLKAWNQQELTRVGAGEWYGFGFRRTDSGRIEMLTTTKENLPDNSWIHDFNSLLRKAQEKDNTETEPHGFEDASLTYPTLLYFSAYRNIPKPANIDQRSIDRPNNWGYKPTHTFSTEGQLWDQSLDNLLVWLKWLDEERFKEALSIINQRVFGESNKKITDVNKRTLLADVTVEGQLQAHRLDQMSSGEKSLLQIFLRLGIHMTGNTIVFIDEIETHLHTTWRFQLMFELMKMAQKHYPGFTLFVTTHTQEVMKAFAPQLTEKNLVKGAYILETAEEEAKAQRIMQEMREQLSAES